MTLAGLGLTAGAAALRWLINFSLVVGVLLLSSPKIRASTILQGLDQRILEVGAFGLGVIAAYLLTSYPVLLVGIVAGMAAMHRAMLVPQYRTAARTDAVTGLHSGSWWNQICEQALERAIGTGSMLGVLILDVDHFKEVNDTYGHVAGDQVLCCVAQAIRAEIRDYDSPGRRGGDEYAIVVPEVSEPELEAIGERICKRVNTIVVPVTSTGGPATVRNLTVSVGGALYAGTGSRTLGELVIAADTALYAAKNNGRGQVCLSPGPLHG
jgi:diguanylate cyclase (GGDEF)-like protein